MDERPPPRLLHELLRERVPGVPVTKVLIAINVAVFVAMWASGAGLWHSLGNVQLAWGANFGPATQDGEWWRLGSAMFIHFGLLHLLMNMWALWDSGQLVERMYGHARFMAIYLASGVAGNLVSLVSHQGSVVAGGASGAVFGAYAALLVYLWRERRNLHLEEFRWLFWGAACFSLVIIVLGMLVPGIDNAAHIGGFVAGGLVGVSLSRSSAAHETPPLRLRLCAAGVLVSMAFLLIARIPSPTYLWREEVALRKEVNAFLRNDAAISRSWQDIVAESKRTGASFDELAGRIDTAIGNRYEESFEHLSQLPDNAALPSAATLEKIRRYARLRMQASRSLAEGLRNKDAKKVEEAMALERQANGVNTLPTSGAQ